MTDVCNAWSIRQRGRDAGVLRWERLISAGSTDGYSEEAAFMRALKDESQFNRPATGEGIPGCGNSPRKSVEAEKYRTDPACKYGFMWPPQVLSPDHRWGPHWEEALRS